jgi:hypothetical protein
MKHARPWCFWMLDRDAVYVESAGGGCAHCCSWCCRVGLWHGLLQCGVLCP